MGKMEGFGLNDWLPAKELQDANDIMQYVTAVEKAFLLMTGVGIEEPSVTIPEKLFTIVTMSIGFVFFAAIIGSMSSIITSTDERTSQLNHQMMEVYRFCHANNLPDSCYKAIHNFYSTMHDVENVFDADFIADLPRTLQLSVKSQLLLPILEKIPLFDGVTGVVMDQLVMSLRHKALPANEVFIHEGDIAESMYVIHRGSVEVFKGSIHLKNIDEGSLIGEIAVIDHDRRTASCRTATFCSLFVLDGKDLDRICEQLPVLAQRLREMRNERLKLKIPTAYQKDISDKMPDWKEIPIALRRMLAKNRLQVLDLFRHFDQNEDGFISRTEFLAAMQQLGQKCTPQEVDNFFSLWDVDYDGRIHYRELKRMLSQTIGTDPLGNGDSTDVIDAAYVP